MTNREVINSMGNAELGQFLDHVDCVNCAYYDDRWGSPEICTRDTTQCAEGITQWLDMEPDFRMRDYIKDGASE